MKRGGFHWVDNFTIQEIVMDAAAAAISATKAAYYDGPMGRGNLLPFTRVPNKLLKPEPLHYCIPACGAHGRFLSVFRTNRELAPVQ